MTVVQIDRFFPRDLKIQFCVRVQERGRKEREAQTWGERNRQGGGEERDWW